MKFFGKPTKLRLTKGSAENRPKAQITLKVKDQLLLFNLGETESKTLAEEFLLGKITIDSPDQPKHNEVQCGTLVPSRPIETSIEPKKRKSIESPGTSDSIRSIKNVPIKTLDTKKPEPSLEEETKQFLTAGQEMMRKVKQTWAEIEEKAARKAGSKALETLNKSESPRPPLIPKIFKKPIPKLQKTQTESDEETAAAIQSVLISDESESDSDGEVPNTDVEFTTVSTKTKYQVGPETCTSAKILIALLERLDFTTIEPDQIEIFMSVFEPLLGFFEAGVSSKWCKKASFDIFFKMNECDGVGAYQSSLSIICKKIIEDLCETKCTAGYEVLEQYLENRKKELEIYLNSTE